MRKHCSGAAVVLSIFLSVTSAHADALFAHDPLLVDQLLMDEELTSETGAIPTEQGDEVLTGCEVVTGRSGQWQICMCHVNGSPGRASREFSNCDNQEEPEETNPEHFQPPEQLA